MLLNAYSDMVVTVHKYNHRIFLYVHMWLEMGKKWWMNLSIKS